MTVVGAIAGLIGSMAPLSQSIVMFQSGRGDDVSWTMVVMLYISTILWFGHAISRKDAMLIFWNSVGLITSTLLAIAKFKSTRRRPTRTRPSQ